MHQMILIMATEHSIDHSVMRQTCLTRTKEQRYLQFSLAAVLVIIIIISKCSAFEQEVVGSSLVNAGHFPRFLSNCAIGSTHGAALKLVYHVKICPHCHQSRVKFV